MSLLLKEHDLSYNICNLIDKGNNKKIIICVLQIKSSLLITIDLTIQQAHFFSIFKIYYYDPSTVFLSFSQAFYKHPIFSIEQKERKSKLMRKVWKINYKIFFSKKKMFHKNKKIQTEINPTNQSC